MAVDINRQTYWMPFNEGNDKEMSNEVTPKWSSYLSNF